MQRKDVLLNIQLWKRGFTTVYTNRVAPTFAIFLLKTPPNAHFLKKHMLGIFFLKHKMKEYLPEKNAMSHI